MTFARRIGAISLAALSLCACATRSGWDDADLDPPDVPLTQGLLDELLRDLRPLVEAVAGSTMKRPVRIRPATRQEIAAVVSREAVEALMRRNAELTEASAREVVAKSEERDSILLGKYDSASHSILVAEEAFRVLAGQRNDPRLRSRTFVRAIVLHELVHALDEDRFGAVTKLPDDTAEKARVSQALVEGHAQFVMKRILDRERRSEVFDAFESDTIAPPPGLSAAERVVWEIQVAETRFAYIEGRRFFEALSGTGKPSFVSDVFTRPPAESRVILHPEEYYAPRPLRAVRDLSAFWRGVPPTLKGRWTGEPAALGEIDLRSAIARHTNRDRAENFLLSVVAAGRLSLQSGVANAVITVIQLDGPQSAAGAYDLLGEVTSAKVEIMKQGGLAEKSKEERSLDLKDGIRNSLVLRSMAVDGVTVKLQSCRAVHDSFVIQVDVINHVVADSELVSLLGAFCESTRR